MSSEFAPVGETAADLWIEQSNLNGVIMAGIAYGILFTLVVQCSQALCSRQQSARLRRLSWPLLVYVSIVFVLATLGFSGNVAFNQLTYIDYRNIPGGPNAFTAQYYAHWTNIMGFSSYVIMSWFADALVIYRFIVIYDRKYWLAIFPVTIFLGTMGSSIALLITMTRPGGSFWIPTVIQLSISYWSLSISLNLILTTLIVCRLLAVRRRLVASLGPDHAKMYTSIVAMIIESAALYSFWALAFLICYARNTPFQNLLLPALGQIQGIAPLLIILRVARGRAWSSSTTRQSSQSSSMANGSRSSASGSWKRAAVHFATNASTTTTSSIPLSNLATLAEYDESDESKTQRAFNDSSDSTVVGQCH